MTANQIDRSNLDCFPLVLLSSFTVECRSLGLGDSTPAIRMDTVAFITTESKDDLIVSFAVQDPGDRAAVQSLTLIRTPKYEFLFEDDERGVRVSFDRYDKQEEDNLQEVAFLETERIVRLKTSLHQYELNVRKVDTEELKQMRNILHKMNYDHRFQTSGI